MLNSGILRFYSSGQLAQLLSSCQLLVNESASMGKGRDYDFQLSVPCYESHPRGQSGGQNFALYPTLRSRKSPWGKDPNVKSPSFPLH